MDELLLGSVVVLLILIAFILKGIAMDTSALKTGFDDFAAKFATFTTDLTAFLNAKTVTPQNEADVKAVTDGLAGLNQSVQNLDKLVNPQA